MGPSPPPPSASAALKFSMPRIAAAALLGMQAHRLSATSKAQCHPLLARMSERASLDRLHSTWPTLSGVSVSAIRLPDPSRRQCMSCMQEPRGGLAAPGLPSEMREGAFSCRTRSIWGAHQENAAWKVHGVQQGSLAWSMPLAVSWPQQAVGHCRLVSWGAEGQPAGCSCAGLHKVEYTTRGWAITLCPVGHLGLFLGCPLPGCL